MAQRPSRQQLTSAQGWPIYAAEGDQVGSIDRVYFDDASGEAEWLRLRAGGKRVLVPAEGVEVQGGNDRRIRVPYSKAQVQNAPEVDATHITKEAERRLYQHYGLRPSKERSSSLRPSEQPASERSTSDQAQQQASDFANQGKEEAAATAQQAQEQASEVTQRVQEQAMAAGERASEVSQQAREQAADLAHEAQAGTRQTIGRARGQAAARMRRTAESVRRVTGGQGGIAAQGGTLVGRAIDQAADYIEERNVGQMLSDTRQYASSHPAQAAVGLAMAGFFLGRLTAPRKRRHAGGPPVSTQTEQEQRQGQPDQKSRLTSFMVGAARLGAKQGARQGQERAVGNARGMAQMARRRIPGWGG